MLIGEDEAEVVVASSGFGAAPRGPGDPRYRLPVFELPDEHAGDEMRERTVQGRYGGPS